MISLAVRGPSFPHYLTSHNTTSRDHQSSSFNVYFKAIKMSAIEESSDGPIEVIQVLIALHPSFGAQELCGPLEVLSNAFHKLKDPGKPPCPPPVPF